MTISNTFFILGFIALILELLTFSYFLLFLGIAGILTGLLALVVDSIYILALFYGTSSLLGFLVAYQRISSHRVNHKKHSLRKIILAEDFSGEGYLSFEGSHFYATGPSAKKNDILIVHSIVDNKLILVKE